MPLYQDEDQIVVTDFGQGRTLAITLKSSAHSVEITRGFIAVQRQIQSVQKHIEDIRQKQEAEGITIPEFDRLSGEIKQWAEKPDMFDAVVDFISHTGATWDNYENREAEARKEPLPFTKDNIATIRAGRLVKVFQNLGRALGITEEDGEKKASPTKSELSLEQSTPGDTEATGSPTGILNSITTAP